MEDKKYILSWDSHNQIWHLMVNAHHDMVVASCEKSKDPGRRYVDFYYNTPYDNARIFPNGTELKNINQKFKYNNICKFCIKKEINNIEEFKTWLIIQKLKYL